MTVIHKPPSLRSLRMDALKEMWGMNCAFSHICQCLELSAKKTVVLAKKLRLPKRKQHPLDRVSIPW